MCIKTIFLIQNNSQILTKKNNILYTLEIQYKTYTINIYYFKTF